jgi:hypothetical protein
MQVIRTYAQIIIFFFSGCLSVSAQDTDFIAVPLDPELIESGENKNFYKYDLGSYNLFIGRRENNLRFKIQNKNTNQIDYANKNSNSDAMIRIPKFFINKDHSIIVILMEEAAEYSWGQEVILILDGTIKNLGYLSYAVLGEEYEESIADYSIIQGNKEKMILSFENVKIIDYSNDDAIINGEDLKFELSLEGIKKIN